MFKKALTLILAASLLVFSASAAFASESGLFSEMIDTEFSDDRLATLDQVAETVSKSMEAGSVTVEISQAYYEGNRVYISYKASGMILEQDGLDLEDGTYADIVAGGSIQKKDKSIVGWKECIVPEDKLADTQTFFLVFSLPAGNEKYTLGVSLKHHDYDHFLQGTSPASAYQARAILYAGKVDLKGLIVLTSPEQAATWHSWLNEEEGTGTDAVVFWVLYQNGEPVSDDLYGANDVFEDDVTFSVMFPAMEDLSGLSIVPEYGDAGVKPEEAIVLEAVQPE